jgi:hypothetical protein
MTGGLSSSLLGQGIGKLGGLFNGGKQMPDANGNGP